MKNLKAFGLLFLALVLGLTAAMYAADVATTQTVASNKVIVAAVDIEIGGKVNPQMLTSVDWPSSSVPTGAFNSIQNLQDRVVMTGVMRGEAILERKLAPLGSLGGLSSVIAQGKRAMTVRVNDVVGVAGFALPGNYVDVMVNAQKDNEKGKGALQISKTVLSRVLVLAVAQEAGRDDTKPRVVSAVTLELSLEDAEKLDLARSVGTLSLVLRNQVDEKNVVTQGITKNQLLGESSVALKKAPVVRRQRRSVAVVAEKPSTCVEVFQNGVMVLKCF
jgi:pilus assembly protein CpaB